MKTKTDLRVVKTNKVLFDALLKLMKEKNFEKIKISDICEEALINRTTFYAHYEDKYELLLALIDNLKDSFLNELKKNENEYLTKEYLIELLKISLNHIDQNREVYRSILSNNRNGILMDFLIEVMQRDMELRLKNNSEILNSNVPLNVIVKFYVGGIINTVVEWVFNKEKYTKDDLILYFDKLIPSNI